MAFDAALLVAGTLAVLLLQQDAPDDPRAALDLGGIREASLPEKPDAARALVYPVVQWGEVDNDEPEGLAHHVGHLLRLSAIGMQTMDCDRHSHAWTNSLATISRLSGPAGDLDGMLATLARPPAPFDLLEAGIARALHAADPLARSVIGTRAQVVSFTPARAAALRDRMHRPENAVLFVSGPMDAATVSKSISGAPGDAAPSGPAPKLHSAIVPAGRGPLDMDAPGIVQNRLLDDRMLALPAFNGEEADAPSMEDAVSPDGVVFVPARLTDADMVST